MKNRIRECRKAAGLSLKELSKLVGTSFVTISRYERGNNEPSIGMWEQLASALHVSPAYLVGWSDEEEEKSLVEKQQHWYESQMGQLKAYADKMVEPLKNIKIPAPTPTHGVEVTLDNGQVVYDSQEYEDMDASSFAGDWLNLDSHCIELKHIVSVEKVEDGK